MRKKVPEFVSMNVSLPREQKEFVESRVAAARHGSVSEYIRALIRRDEKEVAREKLEQMLIEGLESGDPIPLTQETWAELQRKLEQHRQQKRRKKAKGA